MNVSSIEFVVLLVFASAIFYWLPTTLLRQLFLAAANFAFVCTHVPNAACWLALVAFLLSGYFFSRALMAFPSRWLLMVYLLLHLSAFLILKRYQFLGLMLPDSILAHSLLLVGVSYMLFRQIHVAVDAMQGQVSDLSLWTYLNYQANVFGLIAGPVQRYQQFTESWAALSPVLTDWYDLAKAYQRICWGVIKVSAISSACLWLYSQLSSDLVGSSSQPTWLAAGKLMAMFYLYPAHIYFNFSGYCDIMIAAASLFGMRMPENFSLPFLSRNMIEYWTRWHMTLGTWIRDYIFTPMYVALASRWPARAATVAIVCYFIALLLAGVWHGSTWNFVIFGLLNGLGVSLVKLWETWIVRRRGRGGLKEYLQSRPIHTFAVVANFNFVCVTILFFPDPQHGPVHTITLLAKYIS